jgi:DNA-binding CsgD family transcriptional regulator
MTDKHLRQRAERIRALRSEGKTGRQIAKRFGISPEYVSHILNNRLQNDPSYQPKRTPKLKEHTREIMALRSEGKTLTEIAATLGLRLRNKPYSECAIRKAINRNAQ